MEWEYTYTALSHVRQNSMTLLHTSRWWTSNRHILSFWMAVPFSSSFWSSREIALTCTAFIVSSVYEKIVDYYFVVLLKKIFLVLQVPVVLLLYMTSLSTVPCRQTPCNLESLQMLQQWVYRFTIQVCGNCQTLKFKTDHKYWYG